ncbi:hypothetical protein GM921_02990 [Pedobacter sp. LMG 31464]|uniref:Uncharacterized protein n=1 Tax=Pedobacter planticolens TaxID=2679964 RepID=A0A923IU32_9SPHI|nr:hypothetical protein [Pedobacter planticolens]MBB2144436.1 hypothetical protein [Pedobacter planticolens]
MKILITGGNSATALKLVKAFATYQVILADYGEVPSLTSSAYTLISLGEKNEDVLAHTLLNKCLDEGVDLILPIHNFEIEAVVKAETLFNEFNIQVLVPNREELDLYFNIASTLKTGDWVIYKSGEVLFASNSEVIPANNEQKNLNGAFYITKDDTAFKLNLITI